MTDSEATDWESLSEFAQRRDELDPILLRGVLANTLRKRGYGAIVWSEDGSEAAVAKNRLPGILTLTALWGVGVNGAMALGIPWYLAPLGTIVVAVLVLLLIKLSGDSPVVGSLFLLSWAALGSIEVATGFSTTLALGYLLPIATAVSYALATRLLRLRDAQDVALALGGAVRSAPLVAPVVLIVLFLPALSADVWQIAGELSPDSLLVVGVLSVGLLFVVVRLQLGRQLEQVIRQRAEYLSDISERSTMTRQQVQATTGADGEALLDGIDDHRLDASWPVAGEEYAPYLRVAAGETLQGPLTGRLALTVGMVAILFSVYVYLLIIAVVPANVAAEWSQVAVPSSEVDLLVRSVTLHGGPYVNLAALLGSAATATFLAFALVEERFANTLTDALLRDPADRFLAVALPYIRLWEAAIEEGRAARLAQRRPGLFQASE